MTGGAKLDQYMADIASKAKSMTVQVGFMAGSTYPDGVPTALVAALNEYGVPAHNQPPRPFMRSLVQDKNTVWPKIAADLLKANNYDVARTLALMGDGMKTDMQEAIFNFTTPGNAPSTIAKKGKDDPLVRTGHMSNSVESRVVDGIDEGGEG